MYDDIELMIRRYHTNVHGQTFKRIQTACASDTSFAPCPGQRKQRGPVVLTSEGAGLPL